MDIPERAPTINDLKGRAMDAVPDTFRYASEYNGRYLHWSDLRYREFGDSSRECVWLYMKMSRLLTCKAFNIGDIRFSYVINDDLQRMLHDIDTRISSGLFSNFDRTEKERLSIAVGSVMEESITSSQMEGASTTALLAKKILRNNIPPKDRSQRMIVNNYRAMQFIKSKISEPLSPELIKEIHAIISEGTLDDPNDVGRFRKDDSIAVRNRYEDITYYEPVAHDDIDTMIDSLCDFANDDRDYVHPIVRGIIIHFILAFIHPFADGNGRVSRCLFYWYLMKNGYSPAEYLSISKVIKKHRQRYDMSFLLTETDENDLSYFIRYNLEMLLESMNVFTRYLERKTEERNEMTQSLTGYDLNARQMSVLKDIMDSKEPVSVYGLSSKYQISAATIRRDILKMADMGLIVPAGKDGYRQLYSYNKDAGRINPSYRTLP